MMRQSHHLIKVLGMRKRYEENRGVPLEEIRRYTFAKVLCIVTL
jgi:hypothetical protein